jgi:DNA invertase Pin-like site-specific DNA recombinase
LIAARSQNDDKRHWVCQNLSLQLDAQAQQGVTKELTFTDKRSGAKDDRPGLSRCLTSLQPGDTLVVWRLLDDGP